jgi:hypothetical protein
MRKVILAAALAVTFTLPLRSHAQQGGGGASAGGAAAGTTQPQSPATAATQGPGPSGGGVQGGPPTTGNFSVQGQSQGMLEGAGQTSPGLGVTGPQGVVNASPPTPVGAASADPQVELARLRSEVDRLRTELDALKAERSQSGKGTGGSGASADSRPQLLAASATFEGRVRNVSEKSIVVIDRETGEPYVLLVNKGTRARSGEQRIPVASIREGCEVRASFNFVYGDTYATNIEVLPKARR